MDPAVALVRLKHMTAWDVDPTLSADDMTALLAAARRVDSAGRDWTSMSWVPTYHLDWAAREAWAWKAGTASARYAIATGRPDGTDLARNQVFEHCERMYKLYDQKASGQPHSIRSRGATVEDRLGAYSTVPWWWELSGN